MTRRRYLRRGLALAAIFLAAILVLAVAREGVICIVLALPLVVSVGLLGAALGRSLARTRRGGAAPALITLIALPVAILIEPAHTSGRLLHEVTTAVVIDAPPDRVWPHVVSFEGLPPPDDRWFTLGVAYPLYARTAGAGVGAPRACVLSTGTFAERITRWEPARRLTFDVLSSAPPLRELTPFANVHPPHLAGRHPADVVPTADVCGRLDVDAGGAELTARILNRQIVVRRARGANVEHAAQQHTASAAIDRSRPNTQRADEANDEAGRIERPASSSRVTTPAVFDRWRMRCASYSREVAS